MVHYPAEIKFYKIYSDQEPTLVYVGSTSKRLLCQRMSNHKTEMRKGGGCASVKILSKYPDAKIELLLIPLICNDLDERNKFERLLTASEGGCNYRVQGRTKKEYMDVWNANNKEYYRKYRDENREHYKAQKDEYYNGHKEYFKDAHKKYYDANAEAIRAQKRQYVLCECGTNVQRGHLPRHRKTPKHIELTNDR